MEHIRTWTEGPYKLDMWDTFRRDSFGKSVLRYEFRHDEELIFEGEDFCPGASTAIDSDEAVASLLGFLSLSPGDTDEEYFDDYTEAQIAWRDEHAEDLSLIVCVMECPEEA